MPDSKSDSGTAGDHPSAVVDVPEDILTEVLSHMDRSSDLETLKACSATSRTFRIVAQRRIFERVVLAYDFRRTEDPSRNPTILEEFLDVADCPLAARRFKPLAHRLGTYVRKITLVFRSCPKLFVPRCPELLDMHSLISFLPLLPNLAQLAFPGYCSGFGSESVHWTSLPLPVQDVCRRLYHLSTCKTVDLGGIVGFPASLFHGLGRNVRELKILPLRFPRRIAGRTGESHHFQQEKGEGTHAIQLESLTCGLIDDSLWSSRARSFRMEWIDTVQFMVQKCPYAELSDKHWIDLQHLEDLALYYWKPITKEESRRNTPFADPVEHAVALLKACRDSIRTLLIKTRDDGSIHQTYPSLACLQHKATLTDHKLPPLSLHKIKRLHTLTIEVAIFYTVPEKRVIGDPFAWVARTIATLRTSSPCWRRTFKRLILVVNVHPAFSEEHLCCVEWQSVLVAMTNPQVCLDGGRSRVGKVLEVRYRKILPCGRAGYRKGFDGQTMEAVREKYQHWLDDGLVEIVYDS